MNAAGFPHCGPLAGAEAGPRPHAVPRGGGHRPGAGCRLRHRRARQRVARRAGPAGPATIEITSEPGGIHAWLACATRD